MMRNRVAAGFLAPWLLVSSPASALDWDHEEVPYGSEDRQWANIYLAEGTDPTPVLLWAHANGGDAYQFLDLPTLGQQNLTSAGPSRTVFLIVAGSNGSLVEADRPRANEKTPPETKVPGGVRRFWYLRNTYPGGGIHSMGSMSLTTA